MKHLKKYRGTLTKKQQESFRSNARQQAKQTLAKKYKSEYDKQKEVNYKRIRRIYFKELKGGLKE